MENENIIEETTINEADGSIDIELYNAVKKKLLDCKFLDDHNVIFNDKYRVVTFENIYKIFVISYDTIKITTYRTRYDEGYAHGWERVHEETFYNISDYPVDEIVNIIKQSVEE